MLARLKPLTQAVVVVGLSLAALEAMLNLSDPLGLHYLDDLSAMYTSFHVNDDGTYRLPDGEYDYRRWEVTVVNGTRTVPATNLEADCTVVMLGDSDTFGYGVDDEETWVNLVAAAFPHVRVINTGVVGYNSTNVLRTMESHAEADAYLYLFNPNDLDDPLNIAELAVNEIDMPWLVRYTQFMLRYQVDVLDEQSEYNRETDAHTRRFFEELDQIVADERVTLMGFAGDAVVDDMIRQGYAIELLEKPEQTISYVDPHLNVEGNREFAPQVVEIVERVTQRFCGGAFDI